MGKAPPTKGKKMNKETRAWLTMKQYATLTQTSVSSVKRLKTAGRLPYTRFGRRTIRIPAQALDYTWLATWRNEQAA